MLGVSGAASRLEFTTEPLEEAGGQGMGPVHGSETGLCCWEAGEAGACVGLQDAYGFPGGVSCQFWWELGMWSGRRCSCLDILIEAWRHGCSLYCANNVLDK